MKLISTIPLALLLLLANTNAASTQDPCGSHFQQRTYFDDLQVTETVTRRRLTTSEVMELLDRLPNIKTVSLSLDPRRPFSVDSLAYPQYADRYALTVEEWADLQAYCRERLKNPVAVEAVIAHWRSIANGKPPFGLRVQGSSATK